MARAGSPFSPPNCAPEFTYEKIIQSCLFYVSLMINFGLKFNQKKECSLGSK